MFPGALAGLLGLSRAQINRLPYCKETPGISMKRPRTGSVTAKAVADSGRYLRTDHLRTDLKGRSIRSSAVTLVSQGCKFFLQIGMTVVLARLLTPEDYGLFGVAFAVTTFFALFKDLGLSLSTVQSAEINHEQISTLFWINAALGCTLALLVALVTPLISWFYGEPRLASVMLAMPGLCLLA